MFELWEWSWRASATLVQRGCRQLEVATDLPARRHCRQPHVQTYICCHGHTGLHALTPHTMKSASACRCVVELAAFTRYYSSVLVRCRQMPSDAIRCRQMPSDAVRCRQMPSDAVRCRQMPSNACVNSQGCGSGVDPDPAAPIEEVHRNKQTLRGKQMRGDSGRQGGD
jgi:hypothetical protein